MDDSRAPLAVRLAAGVDFLVAASFAALALVGLAGDFIPGVRGFVPGGWWQVRWGPPLVLAALVAGLGWALLKGKRWARVLAIGLAVLGILAFVVDLAAWGQASLERAVVGTAARRSAPGAWSVATFVLHVLVLWLLTRPMARWWFAKRRAA